MNERNTMLAEEPIGKLLTRLSVPGMIAMAAGALYNLVDAIFIGKGVDPLAIGGLAIAFPVMMIIMAVAMAVGVGASSVVSRALGSKDYERAELAAGNSFVVVTVFGVIITVLGLVFLDEIMYLFGATEALIDYATDYMRIVLYGTLLMTFNMSSNNLIRSEGNAKVAMVSMLIGVIMNIILDPIFIFVFDMGVKGAAWATTLARVFSFIWISAYFLSGKSSLKLKWHHLKLNWELVKEILSLGMASFVRQLAGSLFVIVLNHSFKRYGASVAPVVINGEEVSAASAYISLFGIIQRLLSFLFMPMFGIVQGFQPIVGFNYGARHSERVDKTIKLSTVVTVVMGTVAFLIIFLFPAPLIRLFTDEPMMVEMGVTPMRIVMLMMPLVGVQVIGGALFQAIGKAVPALILSLSRQVLFLIPFILIFPLIMGLAGFWWAFPAADFFAIIITAIFMLREIKRINDLKPELEPEQS